MLAYRPINQDRFKLISMLWSWKLI
jgi:hypothetical protein